jgi:hypothetical protein
VRYSSTHSLNLALDGGEWSASRPGRFTPQIKSPRYQFDKKLGGHHSRSGRGVEEKNSQPPPGIEPRSSDLGIMTPATLVSSLSNVMEYISPHYFGPVFMPLLPILAGISQSPEVYCVVSVVCVIACTRVYSKVSGLNR